MAATKRSSSESSSASPQPPTRASRRTWLPTLTASTLLLVVLWTLALFRPWASTPGERYILRRPSLAPDAAPQPPRPSTNVPPASSGPDPWGEDEGPAEMQETYDGFTHEYVSQSPLATHSPDLRPRRVLISAPRRSAPVPNPTGTHLLYTTSAYSFPNSTRTHALRLYSYATMRAVLVSAEACAAGPQWLTATQFIYRCARPERGVTELVVGRTDGPPHALAQVPGILGDMKVAVIEEGETLAIVAAGMAHRNGSIVTTAEAENGQAAAGNELPKVATQGSKKNGTSALVYDATFVRHWDHWVGPERHALFYGLLRRLGGPTSDGAAGAMALSELRNALEGTELESPVPPYPGPEHFDISPKGIAFIAKDPTLDPAWNTRSDAYFLPIPDFGAKAPGLPRKLAVEGFEGAATSPAFAPGGHALAWLQMRANGYESDKNRVLLEPDVARLEGADFARMGVPGAVELLDSANGEGLWDRSPSSVVWGADGKELFLVAEDEGSASLFGVPVDHAKGAAGSPLPQKYTVPGSVGDVFPFADGVSKLLVASSSFVDNSIWTVVDPLAPLKPKVLSAHAHNGSAFALSPSQVSSFRFTGAHGRRIHAWTITPSSYDAKSKKKYPLALLVHGGPQGAWTDAWSTRWNPAVFAELGYIVVMPNPTGSTGYGKALTDAIAGDWGGAPYEDLVACMDSLASATAAKAVPLFDAIDLDRAVALGASFGGFMMNWINGHELGRRFKALVCHDGVFNMAGQLTSDEQYFPLHEFGRTDTRQSPKPFWDDPSAWDRWDPARHIGKWQTPTLVVHGGRDYRLLIGEGLGAFNALQRRGVKSRLLVFPDEGHWVLGEENSRAWHVVVMNWITSSVGLPPVGDKPEVQVPRRKAST